MVAVQMPREFISHPFMKQVTVALTTVPGLVMPSLELNLLFEILIL
jgi:hypothetical protein